MKNYRIEFSYDNGVCREYEWEYEDAFSAQEAVDIIRDEYGQLEGFRIEEVWVERSQYDHVEGWE